MVILINLGTLNYPNCDITYNWVYLNKPLMLKKETYDNLLSLLKPDTYADGGNYVTANVSIRPVNLLENSFKN
jgi:hypothetical protein